MTSVVRSSVLMKLTSALINLPLSFKENLEVIWLCCHPRAKNWHTPSILGVCTSQSLVTTTLINTLLYSGRDFLFSCMMRYILCTRTTTEKRSGTESTMPHCTPIARGYVLHHRWANACAKKAHVPWRQMPVVTNINEPDLAPL